MKAEVLSKRPANPSSGHGSNTGEVTTFNMGKTVEALMKCLLSAISKTSERAVGKKDEISILTIYWRQKQ